LDNHYKIDPDTVKDLSEDEVPEDTLCLKSSIRVRRFIKKELEEKDKRM
jgi:hypothetical protein